MVMVVSGAKKAAWRQWCTQQVMSRSVEGKSMRGHAFCMLHVPSGPPGFLKPAPSRAGNHGGRGSIGLLLAPSRSNLLLWYAVAPGFSRAAPIADPPFRESTSTRPSAESTSTAPIARCGALCDRKPRSHAMPPHHTTTSSYYAGWAPPRSVSLRLTRRGP